jgi:hypothetical protein
MTEQLLPQTPAVAEAPAPVKPEGVKLTKKGVPDKRSQSSKNNISKAHIKVKKIVDEDRKLTEAEKIVEKAKMKRQAIIIEEEDEDSDETESDDDDAYIIQKVTKKEKIKKPDVAVAQAAPIAPLPSVPVPSVPIVSDEMDYIKKHLDELKEENEKLRMNIDRSKKLTKISNLSSKMLLRF